MLEPHDGTSDADREAAVAFLQELVRHGKLQLDEFSDAAGRAMAARTHAELAQVMTTLPSIVAITPRARRLEQPLILSVNTGTLKMTGRWQLGATTRASVNTGKLWLDLSEAEFDDRVIDLDARVNTGTITIVVPRGVDIQLLGIRGAIRNRLDTQPGVPGAPLVRLNASVVTGSITLQRPDEPRRRWFRRRRRALSR